jgi:hypothetical protein
MEDILEQLLDKVRGGGHGILGLSRRVLDHGCVFLLDRATSRARRTPKQMQMKRRRECEVEAASALGHADRGHGGRLRARHGGRAREERGAVRSTVAHTRVSVGVGAGAGEGGAGMMKTMDGAADVVVVGAAAAAVAAVVVAGIDSEGQREVEGWGDRRTGLAVTADQAEAGSGTGDAARRRGRRWSGMHRPTTTTSPSAKSRAGGTGAVEALGRGRGALTVWVAGGSAGARSSSPFKSMRWLYPDPTTDRAVMPTKAPTLGQRTSESLTLPTTTLR